MVFLVNVEVKQSKIASGYGCYTKQAIKKGSVVCIFTVGANIMPESEYQEEQRKGNEYVIKTGVRYVGKYFLYKDKIEDEEYINHSFDPNLLYHCGICFAARDIQEGEELSLDYKYIFAENDVTMFKDNETDIQVNGIPPKRALVETAKQLLELLGSVDNLD